MQHVIAADNNLHEFHCYTLRTQKFMGSLSFNYNWAMENLEWAHLLSWIIILSAYAYIHLTFTLHTIRLSYPLLIVFQECSNLDIYQLQDMHSVYHYFDCLICALLAHHELIERETLFEWKVPAEPVQKVLDFISRRWLFSFFFLYSEFNLFIA